MGYLFVLLVILHTLHRKFTYRQATVELIKYRSAWEDCINYSKEAADDGREVLEVICEHARCIRSRLSQQMQEARKSLSLQGKVFAWLEERAGRWSLRGEGKGRQKESNLDLLMRHAGTVNEAFQDLISEIGFNGSSVNRRAGLEFLTGPVKQPMRILEKLVRKYRRDVGCLTDLVRCTVVADNLVDVMNFFLLVESMSVVGLAENTRQDPCDKLGEQIFRITSVQNRFDNAWDDKRSMGYRDLCLNVEVGWIISNEGVLTFQKVRDWTRLCCITHICEIQVRSRILHTIALEGHSQYCHLRNVLSQ
jgi:hypothetical protein